MSLSLVKAWHYNQPLETPIPIKSESISTRSGLIIGLFDRNGTYGLGDTSPLPHFSPDTLEDVFVGLANLIDYFPDRAIPTDLNGVMEMVQTAQTELGLCVSLQFALEMALINLLAKRHATPPAALLNGDATATVQLHGLLSGDVAQLRDKYQTLSEAGYTQFKLKVGQLNPDDEADRLIQFLGTLSKEHTLFLDANRQWPLSVAVDICAQLPTDRIAYIEEPVELPSEQALFYEKTNIPYAIDETLIESPELIDQMPAGLSTLVLKPMCLGLTKVLDYVHQKPDRVDVALSSIYETPIAHQFYAQMGAAFSSKRTVGIDTSWCERLFSKGPEIDLSELPNISPYQLLHLGRITRWAP